MIIIFIIMFIRRLDPSCRACVPRTHGRREASVYIFVLSRTLNCSHGLLFAWRRLLRRSSKCRRLLMWWVESSALLPLSACWRSDAGWSFQLFLSWSRGRVRRADGRGVLCGTCSCGRVRCSVDRGVLCGTCSRGRVRRSGGRGDLCGTCSRGRVRRSLGRAGSCGRVRRSNPRGDLCGTCFRGRVRRSLGRVGSCGRVRRSNPRGDLCGTCFRGRVRRSVNRGVLCGTCSCGRVRRPAYRGDLCGTWWTSRCRGDRRLWSSRGRLKSSSRGDVWRATLSFLPRPAECVMQAGDVSSTSRLMARWGGRAWVSRCLWWYGHLRA